LYFNKKMVQQSIQFIDIPPLYCPAAFHAF